MNQLILQESQVAGPPMAVWIIIVVAVAAWITVPILSYLGVNYDRLIRKVNQLDNSVDTVCRSKNESDASKALRRIKDYGKSYNNAVHTYCEDSQEGLNAFKEMVPLMLGPGDMEECRFAKLFPNICPSRQWFCEVIKKAKSCIDERGMKW